jgi:hypothetical protein
MMLKQLLKLVFINLISIQLVAADTIVVITAHELPIKQISLKELKNIFRRKALLDETGKRWIPLNLEINHPLRQTFSEKVFALHPEEMESYWNEQYFQGIMPPYVVTSEEAMLRFVSSTQGAIGYILPCHLDARVQVVMRLRVLESVNQSCAAPKQ